METQQVSERETKALEIADRLKLVRNANNIWIVPSQSGPKQYTVTADPETLHCTCPDFEHRQLRCKHIYAVEYTIQREQTATVRPSLRRVLESRKRLTLRTGKPTTKL